MSRKFLVSSLATFALVLSVSVGRAGDKPEASQQDPLQIVVSLNDQSMRVFRGTEVIASSHLSSGKPGHSTPTGIFSILAKAKYHRSNIYSGAPMPWMQRLTWTGIALHESNHVPDYPASHGCVRLPGAFARELFSQTRIGEHVVIAGDPVTPEQIEDAALPQPRAAAPYDPRKDHWRVLYETAGSLDANPAPRVSTAALLAPVRDRIGFARAAAGAPLRILITRRSRQEITANIQAVLNRLGYDAGPVDGLVGPATWGAVKRFQEDHAMPANGSITPEVTRALFAAAGLNQPEAARLYVRQDFAAVRRFHIHRQPGNAARHAPDHRQPVRSRHGPDQLAGGDARKPVARIHPGLFQHRRRCTASCRRPRAFAAACSGLSDGSHRTPAHAGIVDFDLRHRSRSAYRLADRFRRRHPYRKACLIVTITN